MATATSKNRHPEYGRLGRDTELGTAMLIAEDAEGHYEVVGTCCSIGEGREIAYDDMRRRMRLVEKGDDAMCPDTYKIWSRGWDGAFCVAYEMDACTFKARR